MADDDAEPTGLADLRALTRRLVGEWQDAGRFTPRIDSWLRSFDVEFSRLLARHQLVGMTMPVEWGGAGRSYVERLAVTEELLRAGAPVAAHWIGDRQIGPAVLRHGNRELQAEILPAIASVDAVFCLGMSEPQAGSDLAAVRTRAERVPGGWRISGHKIWTSHAHRATHCYVLARTDLNETRHRGLSEFVVDMTAPGVEVSPIVDMAGEHHFNEVRFDGVFVAEHRLLGAEGRGWPQVVEQLSFERGGPERFLSSYPTLRLLLSLGESSTNSALRQAVGGLVARLATLRRLAYQTAAMLDLGQAPIRQAASLKYLGNAFELDVVECLRRLPSSPERDRQLRDGLLASPGFALRGGSRDIVLSLIAKDLRRVGT